MNEKMNKTINDARSEEKLKGRKEKSKENQN